MGYLGTSTPQGEGIQTHCVHEDVGWVSSEITTQHKATDNDKEQKHKLPYPYRTG